MPVRLKVTNTEHEADNPSEYIFEEDRVKIGRSNENDLTLSDPQRVVSSQHAEVRCGDGNYKLVDRGSKNFTYLRGQRLEAGEPYELMDGDVFQIGYFEIEFTFTETETGPAAAPGDETVFAADFSNPFDDPAQQLLEALNEITEGYNQEPPQRRDDALEDALRRADAEVQNHEAIKHVIALLGIEPSDEISPGGESSSSEPSVAPEGASRDTDSKTPRSPQPDTSSRARIEAETPAKDQVLDTLLEALSTVIEIPWQFRHEFIGQTIMRSSDTKFLYEGDAETMKKHLLDASLSQEERQERLAHVEDAAESLAVHQVAMLNGYKASVMKGADELLEELNPDAHQAEVAEENPVYEYLPLLASPAVLDRVRAEWHNLRRRDWSVAEQRIFRPAFIKAYLSRMTAADTPGDKSPDSSPTPENV